mmetsp:Transcript_42626/g.89134  ORF Transcript_42626/g.89134 Transcript_42626/m.89134 type:complete len:224 (-) Transcript_42626:51-722(-)
MLAVIAAMGNNRGTLASSTRIRESRKIAIEHLKCYVKGLEENPAFREVMASQCESSTCLNAIGLLELIQKFGTGTFLDSEGHEVDIIHHVSTSLQHRPPSPSEDEISWILSAGSRLRANRMVTSDIKFSLELWNVFESNRAHFEEVYRNHAHGDLLKHDQIKAFLADLNDGIPPADSEASAVMSEAAATAGGVCRTRLLLATSLWYGGLVDLRPHACGPCAVS